MFVSRKTRQALGLLRATARAQGARYAALVVAAALVAGVELLPPRVYAFFTAGAPALAGLSEAAATVFLREFLTFGLIVAAVLLVTRVAWDLAQEWMFLRTEAGLRREALRTVHGLPLEALDDTQRGDWLTRVSADLRGVEQFIAVSLPAQVRALLVLLGVSITFLCHAGGLALALLASALALATLNAMVQLRLKPVMEQLRAVHGGILQALLESFEGLATIRSLGAEAFVAESFEAKVQTIVKRGFALVRITSLVGGANGFLTSALAASCLTVVGWRVSQRTLTVHDALLYPFYLGMFYSSALAAVGSLGSWSRFLVEGGRLAEFLYGSVADGPVIPADVTPVGSVVLARVTVGFPGGEPLTQPFALRLTPGRTLLVRGPSGCGKSTLLEMLAGLRQLPTGVVEAGGLGGPSRWEAPIRLPLAWFAFVEQRPYIFEGTVRENLAPKADGDSERLWRTLRLVNLDTFVERAGGLDLMLRDSGKNLSEGQKYRLVLARALLADRPFLLVDEPFASLDPFSVSTVAAALNAQRAAGTGIVLVSHTLPVDLAVDDVLDFGVPSLVNRRHRIPGDARI